MNENMSSLFVCPDHSICIGIANGATDRPATPIFLSIKSIAYKQCEPGTYWNKNQPSFECVDCPKGSAPLNHTPTNPHIYTQKHTHT